MRRWALGGALALGLAACEEPASSGFHVTFSYPRDGETAYRETPVRLGFSAPLDRAACGRQAVSLAAVDDEGRVLWFEDYELADAGDENTFELVHDGLTEGYEHVLSVQSGDLGCLSATGDAVAPYEARFPVVARDP